MGQFRGITPTRDGLDLLAKALTGKVLKFTRVAVGDGILPDGTHRSDMTRLVNPLHDLTIRAVEVLRNADNTQNTGKAIIRSVLSNKKIEAGFFARELGVFAEDPDTEEEVLYGYGNAGYEADYIPAYGGSDVVEYLFNLTVVIDRATCVTAIMTEGLVFVTQPEFERRMVSLFGESKPVMEFWIRTEGDDKKLRPAGLPDARMALIGVKDMQVPREKYLELSNAAIQNAINHAVGQCHDRKALKKEREERIKGDADEAKARVDGEKKEADARDSEDKKLWDAINREKQDRADGDTTLQNSLNAEAQARRDGDSAEARARQNGDNVEATARANADNSIWNKINGMTFNDLTGNLDVSKIIGLETAIKQNSVGITEYLAAKNGYAKFSNGLMVQWGNARIANADNNDYVSFPRAFPTQCFTVVASSQADLDVGGRDVEYDALSIFKYDRLGFHVQTYINLIGSQNVNYIAIGN